MTRPAASPWPLLALLSFSVLINYLDRSNLSAAAPLLSHEMGLSDSQLGLLLSAFFCTYALCQVPAGWLVDRFPVASVYGWGFLLWSLATGATAFSGSFTMLLAMRLMLGAGESVAFPAYSRILVHAFAENQRGLANSILDACTKLGPALGIYFAAWFMHEFGWRAFFLVTGFGALLWLPFWLKRAPARLDRPAEALPETGPGWLELLGSRTVWATFIGLFCHNYNWYLLLTWLPTILVREQHFTMTGMGAWNAVLLVWTALATLVAGWFSDRLSARAVSVAHLRRSFLVAGLVVTGLAMPFTAAPRRGFPPSHWALRSPASASTSATAGPSHRLWRAWPQAAGRECRMHLPIWAALPLPQSLEFCRKRPANFSRQFSPRPRCFWPEPPRMFCLRNCRRRRNRCPGVRAEGWLPGAVALRAVVRQARCRAPARLRMWYT